MFVNTSRAVTSTPGTTAPLTSVTVPRIVDKLSWPSAEAPQTMRTDSDESSTLRVVPGNFLEGCAAMSPPFGMHRSSAQVCGDSSGHSLFPSNASDDNDGRDRESIHSLYRVLDAELAVAARFLGAEPHEC